MIIHLTYDKVHFKLTEEETTTLYLGREREPDRSTVCFIVDLHRFSFALRSALTD
jgi:hypothetical protein